MNSLTGYVYDVRLLWHSPGSAHVNESHIQPLSNFEHPDTKSRAHALLAKSGLLPRLVQIPLHEVSREDLLRVHTLEYVETLEGLGMGAGDAGEAAYWTTGSIEAAKLAAGGAFE